MCVKYAGAPTSVHQQVHVPACRDTCFKLYYCIGSLARDVSAYSAPQYVCVVIVARFMRLPCPQVAMPMPATLDQLAALQEFFNPSSFSRMDLWFEGTGFL